MVVRKWFFRKNIGRYLEAARISGNDERFEIDDAGTAHQHEEAAGPNEGKFTPAENPVIFGGDVGENWRPRSRAAHPEEMVHSHVEDFALGERRN